MHQKTKLSSSLAQCLIILTISDLNPNALVSSGARQTSAHPLRGASFTRTQVANISPFARLAPRSLRNNLPPPPTGSQAPHNVSLPVPNTTYLQANRLHYQPTLSAQVASRESIFEWHSQRQPSNQVAANQWLQPKRATDFQLARPATEPANGQQHHLSRASVAEGVSLAAPPSEQHGGKLEKLFRGAKNLLSSSINSLEQRAADKLWLGFNLFALLIPVLSLTGVTGGYSGASVGATSAALNETNKRRPFAGRLVSSLASLGSGQPIVAALANGGLSGLQNRVDSLMGWLERSTENLPNFPRLHPQECFKRSICEAHNEPSKYGALGMTLTLLFPATNGSAAETDNMEFKVINKYRHAASYGLQRRLEAANGTLTGPQLACKDKYDECLVSLLEVGQKLLDFFLT